MYIHCRLLAWMVTISSTVHIHIVVSRKSVHGRSSLQVCQRGGWALFCVFWHLQTTKERPCHVSSDSMPSKQINTWNHHWLQSRVLTAHNTLNSCTQWAWGNLQCAPNYLRPSMQKCLVVTFGTVLQEVLISDMHSTVLLKLHTKLAPGWALIQVNFYPMWEIIK